MSSHRTTVEQALKGDFPHQKHQGLVGDLSDLSRRLIEAKLPELLKCLKSDEDLWSRAITELQRESGNSGRTLKDIHAFLLHLLESVQLINDRCKGALLGFKHELTKARERLQHTVNSCVALWPAGDYGGIQDQISWNHEENSEDPQESGTEAEWLHDIFFKSIPEVPTLSGSPFQLAMVYQHLRLLFAIDSDQSSHWRTVRTPVLGASEVGNDGSRLILTVSLRRSQLQTIIPDLRYFGFTELKRDDPDECLLASVQRCWKAAKLTGWLGVWRMEHGKIEFDSKDGTSTRVDKTHLDGTEPIHTHIYGRSFEAAFLCCLRAAAGNAYDDELPEDTPANQYARAEILRLDPLLATTAITAKIGPFDPDTTKIRDIPLIAVGGVPQKLTEASGTELDHVVFASDQWSDAAIGQLDDGARKDFQKSQRRDQQPENRSKLQWSTVRNLGDALDALLLRNRWLKAWQAERRTEWLVRWQRPETDAEPNSRGPLAPGDDAPWPDTPAQAIRNE
jgi:hypothetical protein